MNTARWVEEVRAERGADVVVVLVGNKTDLVERRQVTTEEGDARGREAGVLFIETSAKAGFNIKARLLVVCSASCTPAGSDALRCGRAQALFRKIAAALPGMETLGAGGAGREDLIDVTLAPSAGSQPPAAASCSC